MTRYASEEERLGADALRALQRRKLAAVLEAARRSAFYGRKLDGVSFDPARDELARLPFTTRQQLQDDQQNNPPYGTVGTEPVSAFCRLHQTSGSTGEPLRWLDTPESWAWWKHCWSIVYLAAGVQPVDRMVFTFSFGPFIGFWSAFEAAAELGHLCLPAGGMTTVARLRFMLDNEATVLCCTPTYAMHLADKARREQIDIAGSAVRLIIVAGEPGGSVPGVRQRIESAWGARMIDHAGMTEIGAWGFECVEAPGGMHVIESEFIAEVVDPATGDLVSEGAEGELVLTNLGRLSMPLIRYRTGDQVVLARGACACGRRFVRAEGGVRGRFDDMLSIRGNNVFPSAVENVIRRFEEIVEFRLSVRREAAPHPAGGAESAGPQPGPAGQPELGGLAELLIEIEAAPACPGAPGADDSLARRVAQAVRDALHFRPTVKRVACGTLPRFEMKARRVASAPHGGWQQ